MTDFKLLHEIIDDSGMTMAAISEKAGMNRATLYNRLDGIGEFSAREIMGLCNALRISKDDRERIFFALDVPKMGREELPA